MATYSKRDITFPSKLEGDVFLESLSEAAKGCDDPHPIKKVKI